ncbi:TIGR04222 domain-containing membrane protein [Streptomyces sp. NPDC048606]|uniref:TIGR04222 domain-containing membrane protein n=1 Tax=Streptomyces sp. NPDC048606 TaxID=3154726 RepID=UPI003446FCAB
MWLVVLFVPAALSLAVTAALRWRAGRAVDTPRPVEPRPPGDALTVYELAWLRSPVRDSVAEVALAVLRASGRLPLVDRYDVDLGADPPREEVQAAAYPTGEKAPATRSAAKARAAVSRSEAVTRVTDRLNAQGLIVNREATLRYGRAMDHEAWAATATVIAGLGAVVWTVLGSGDVPWAVGSFVALLGCWAVARHRRHPWMKVGHATRAGRALYRETLADTAWDPRTTPRDRIPAPGREDVAAVARTGLRGCGRFPDLLVALDGPPPKPAPASKPSSSSSSSSSSHTVNDPPGLGGVSGCGGGCGGCGGGL